MPTVNGKEFPYDKKGIADAKAAAEKSGQPLEMKHGKKKSGKAPKKRNY